MGLIRLLIRTSPRLLALAAIASLASGFSSAGMIALISRKLTDAGPLTADFLLLFSGLLVVVVALDLAAKQTLVRLTARTNYELGMWLVRRILSTPLRSLEETGAARLTAALTDDLSQVGGALTLGPTMLVNSAILAGCMAYMLWLSPVAFAVMGSFILPAIFGQAFLHRRARGALRAAYRERDRLFQLYRTVTEGLKDLKLHTARRTAFRSELLEPSATAFQGKLVTGRSYHAMSTTWGQTVFFLFVLGLFVLAALTHTDIALLTGYALLALYMRSAINALLNMMPVWAGANLALERVEQLGLTLAADAEADDAPAVAPEREQPVSIALHGVTHTYWREEEESNFTLGPIDLALHSGELVFLTGANGSGKTTLVKLLTGLYLPEGGEIRFNGEALSAENAARYRSLFTAVFADSFVFDQLLGVQSESLDDQALAYLRKLKLDKKVTVHNGKLSTTELSTGQRSRLALLLAYLDDRPIYVFDEWAAGQDPVFKDLFYRQFLPELRDRGKLVIVVSHDDHYYAEADRVVKLDSGRVEYDRGKELVATASVLA